MHAFLLLFLQSSTGGHTARQPCSLPWLSNMRRRPAQFLRPRYAGNEPASLSHRARTGNLGKSDLLVLVLAHQTRAVVAGLLTVCLLRYCALLECSLVNGCCFRLQVEGAELHVIGRQLGIATSQVLRVGAGLSCNLSLVRTTGQSLAPTVTRSHAP